MTQENTAKAAKEEDLAQEVPITRVSSCPETEDASVEMPEQVADEKSGSAATAVPESSESEQSANVPESPKEPTLEEQLAEMKGNYLRALAENENYRKRMARELQDTREQSRIKTIGEMVGVYDLLQMAVDHAAKATDVTALRQGLEMSFGEFKRILKGMGVEVLDAMGKPFDPAIHEALSTLNSDEVPEGVVLQQWKPGFKVGEKLLRPATVVVSKGPANPPSAAEEAESSGEAKSQE
ncbi:MAG: nucleotide exchange factor GrpE [Victivallales bacterium]|nr:nucleotide exchange factor GrpE [Victivallales bacterium]